MIAWNLRLASFDFVEIDVTSLGDLTAGLLVFQLLGSDNDNGTQIEITNLTNTLDQLGIEAGAFPVDDYLASRGDSVNLADFTQSTDLQPLLSNVRFDSATGRYTAELRIMNHGAAIGRHAIVSFPDLPAGVSLLDPSGVTPSGVPYLSLRNAIQSGGLLHGSTSDGVQIEFDNAQLLRFALTPQVLAGPLNQGPTLAPIDSVTLKPGQFADILLDITDTDGDSLTVDVLSQQGELPTGRLSGNLLRFQPTFDDVGMYDLPVTVSDGVLQTSRSFQVTVEPDATGTTRISGVVQNVDLQPLPGLPVEIGGVQTTTDANGAFFLEFAGALPSDTLKIHGEGWTGSEAYPFIAEKLPLVLGHEVFENLENAIVRPIFLPALDTAQAQPIDPATSAFVVVSLQPNEAPATVSVAAGSLEDQQGNPYTGNLSITEVPRDLTPAALPGNVMPDVVVTIQPGEMVFTQPAPLSLPNRAGYPVDELFDLMSINPVTGDFDVVGTGRVTGTQIETIEGGVRNSSWHFFRRRPPELELDPLDLPENEQDGCNCDCPECEATVTTGSRVELHSGSYIEYHELVGYQSQGQTRSWQLTYDSKRVTPQPIVQFGYANVQSAPDRRLGASVSWRPVGGSFNQAVGLAQGGGGSSTAPSFQHYWSIPADGNFEAALQVDMRHAPSGHYNVELKSGLVQYVDGQAFGVSNSAFVPVEIVNTTDSVFGAGWGLNGLTELVLNPDGSILRIDGDGSELLFTATGAGTFTSPPGDFSTLELVDEGSGSIYRRTFKNQTVDRYRSVSAPSSRSTPQRAAQIETMTDRNGNETRFEYDSQNRLSRIIDPVGLATVLNYAGGKVTSITDPAGRATELDYDAAGNLIRISDQVHRARGPRRVIVEQPKSANEAEDGEKPKDERTPGK